MIEELKGQKLKEAIQIDILRAPRLLYVERYRQHLWWSGYIHNLSCTDDLAVLTNKESLFSILKRHFHSCENDNRFLYEYEYYHSRTLKRKGFKLFEGISSAAVP